MDVCPLRCLKIFYHLTIEIYVLHETTTRQVSGINTAVSLSFSCVQYNMHCGPVTGELSYCLDPNNRVT